ncbi:MAG: D-cysteine desulfhydrase family protein [Nitrososphaerales archaeon]|jgi:D-cysteine desulfhydrase family pyridoxal phosphate-dependent enzyme
MRIRQLERLGMGVFPTPFEPMPRLQEELGGPRLFVKRDDLTGVALGGNKIRQLDYILVEAKKKNADYVITTCGVQSNWSRQTAALAAKMGMKALLVLRTAQFKTKPKVYDGNTLLDHIMGAEIKIIDMRISEDPAAILEEEAEKLRRKGHRPFVLGLAASVSPLATAAYAYGFIEMTQQASAMNVKLDAVFVATSAGPTQAGLILGAKIMGLKTKVIGVNVGAYSTEKTRKVILESSEGAAKLLGTKERVREGDIIINDDYAGEDYGISTKESIAALRLVARTEALILDPVYTAKTMAGMIDMVKKGEFEKGQNICFLHTGGIPALFAYKEQFQPGR